MSTVSDSADEFVKIMLDGTEVVARLTGSMAKEMAVMLYAMTKETKNKTKGQTRLNNMLKSNSNFKIFTIKKENYQDFKKQAKRYGVLYSALGKKNNISRDGVIDILIKEEDANRVNRIVERFNLVTVDQTAVEKVIEETEKQISNSIGNEKAEVKKEIQEKNTSQDLLNKLMKKQNIKEENENTNPSSISIAEKEVHSENLSKVSDKMKGTKKEEKPSIREKIKTIEKEMEEKENSKVKENINETSKKENTKETMHKQPKKKNKKRKGESRV